MLDTLEVIWRTLMDKIISAFETTLFDPILSESVKKLADLGIDSLLEENVFASIPVVNLMVGAAKTAQNIHDRNLLKQTVKFINTFNEGTIEKKKLNKHKEKLNNDSKYAENELGRVIILLNSNVDLKKSEILARFYKAYIEEDINWFKFCELADVTSRTFIMDLEILKFIFQRKITDSTESEIYQIERLVALGLINTTTKSMTIGSNDSSQTENYVQTSSLRDLFCSIIFN